MKIKLEDGTILNNLILNGNNYISDKIIPNEIFENNLSTVTISDGEAIENHSNMKLVANRVIDGKTWFILAEKTVEELEKEQTETLLSEMMLTSAMQAEQLQMMEEVNSTLLESVTNLELEEMGGVENV